MDDKYTSSLFSEEETSAQDNLITVLEPEVLSDDNITETSLVKVYKETLISSVKLSLKGQRLLRVILSRVSSTDQQNKVYSFSVSDYMTVYGIDKYPKEQLSEAADELLKTRDLPYEDDPEGFTKAGLISYLDVKDGVARFSIPPRLLEFYNAAREKNEYLLGYTKSFVSSYSYPFYELFLLRLAENTDNPNGVEFYMSIDRLRKWLRLENKYVNKKTGAFAYNNFKTKILNCVMDDINRSIDDENPQCNINFKFKEEKKGRAIAGITFVVWRVAAAKPEDISINPYYDALPADAKIGYDTLIALMLKPTDIENCILDYGFAQFRDIVRYAVTKKHKGRAYLTAILKGGWVNSDPVRSISFINLAKVYNSSDIEKELLTKVESFILSLPASTQKIVLQKIKAELKDAPQVYKHVESMSIDEILNAKDIKIFIIEQLALMIKAGADKDLHALYVNFENVSVKKNKIAGREEIVSLLEKYKVNEVAWEDILEHDDEYIKANISYCAKKYASKQEDFSGAIVDAMKKDYAQYEKTKAEQAKKAAELAARKKAEAEKHEQIKSAMLEIDEIYEEFINNSTVEEREEIKKIALDEANDFMKNTVARALKVSAGELYSIPVDKLLNNVIFKKGFKSALNKTLNV